MSKDCIGFVGLGNMGLPLARNLVAAGYTVAGYDLHPNEEFERAGGIMARELADLGYARAIIQSLPNAAAFKSSIDELLPTCRKGQIFVELSSYALSVKQEQAERLRQVGSVLLDCEISGLPAQAAARKAVIFKSGDEATIDELKPIFDAMAQQHFYLGSFGAATKMKLIANTMVCVHNLMAAEALNLGQRAGLDPDLIAAVLGPSAAGSATFSNKVPLMLSRTFRPGRGPFRHMFGYLSRARELAEQVGASTPLLLAAQQIYAQAEQELRHEEDIAAVLEIVENMSGHGESK